MSAFDRKRIGAVAALERQGYKFDGFEWQPPADHEMPGLPDTFDGDAILAIMHWRADMLAGCTENSPQEEELTALIAAIEAYEHARWPRGKVPNGKA